ncbi:Chromosome (plasmid) partitioning protein ParA [hydrothermal vent metagenome]|uniref:Chromosome (Plasmid) partitioning protein ParA n=1 Tax=hydrothermal vent metagenome TaxID=652676 RepID=A0A3B0Y8L6_9ZZZZ
MRTILVMNAKGGSGKSTICTNLASYFAHNEEANVCIEDHDQQGSSTDWLTIRPDDYPTINGLLGWKGSPKSLPGMDYIILDAPAAIKGKELAKLIRRAETILIPVLPSPMDIRAAARFIQDILLVGKVSKKQVKIGVIANRVREYTQIFQQLERFLKRLDFSFVARFRDTQNYVRSAEKGIGLHEMPPSTVYEDIDQWETLIKWLKSKRSLPNK